MNIQTPSDLRAIRARSAVGEAKFRLKYLIHLAIYVLYSVLAYVLSRALNVPESRVVGALFALLVCFAGIEMIEDGRRKGRPKLVFLGSLLLFAPAIGFEIAPFFSRWH
ncbi:MAG TPA: hypothetical protein VFO25_11890 [Candidatus Eremiobacteraceae bacterium]|nr:hypothetical protein [Candidatus Eremiobacteraceae bacterium]